MIITGATINVNCKIGNHNIINTNSSIDHNSKIGNFINISPGVNVAGSAEIKDKSFIGMNSSIKEKVICWKEMLFDRTEFIYSNINCKQNSKYFGLPLRKLMTNKKLKILVTGGAGFVGSHLCEKLDQEFKKLLSYNFEQTYIRES